MCRLRPRVDCQKTPQTAVQVSSQQPFHLTMLQPIVLPQLIASHGLLRHMDPQAVVSNRFRLQLSIGTCITPICQSLNHLSFFTLLLKLHCIYIMSSQFDIFILIFLVCVIGQLWPGAVYYLDISFILLYSALPTYQLANACQRVSAMSSDGQLAVQNACRWPEYSNGCCLSYAHTINK